MKDLREKMVYQIKTYYGMKSPEILSVMLQIPRHKFVAGKYRKIAYDDVPVPLTSGATLSQPYTVAFMTDLLELTGREKVLEIGSGSGYQAAVLSKLCRFVYGIEIISELVHSSKKVLKGLGINNVNIKEGSGENGWLEMAPFDAILITAGIDKIPSILFEQLKTDGVLVAPVGSGDNKIMKRFVKRVRGGVIKLEGEDFGEFRFVPFVKKN